MALNIEVIERFRVRVGTRTLANCSRKSRALIAYLALKECHEATRDALVGLLWSESSHGRGRASLRQAVYEVQTELQAASGSALEADKEVVRLPSDGMVVDVLEAIRLASESKVHPAICSQQRVIESVLVDLESVDPVFREWVLAQRQLLQDRLVSHLEGSVQKASCAKHRHEILQALLQLDPTNEAAARELMLQRAQDGDVGGALRIYKGLWDVLDKEFDVEPTADTQNLVVALKLEQPAADLHGDKSRRLANAPKTISELTGTDFSRFGTGVSVTERLGLPLLPTPQLPSIAVLPFRNDCIEGIDSYFSDGIVEDILISLAALRELFVIARGSTLAFRFYENDPIAIGKLLGVRYLVSGSIHRRGRRIRVAIELCETENGRAIWVAKWEADLEEIFNLQDQVVAEVAAKIAPHIRQEELRRSLRKPPSTFTAYDHLLKALDLINRREPQTFKQAEVHLLQARELEPTFAQPFAWSAWTHLYRIGVGWSADIASDSAQSALLASRALELDDNNARALAVYGHLKAFLHHDYDAALDALNRALKACPNEPFCWALSSASMSYVGHTDSAVANAEHAMRLSPLDRYRFYYAAALCLAHYTAGGYREAIKWGRISLHENPIFTPNLRYLAAALSASNDTGEARNATATLLKLQPDFTLKSYSEGILPLKGDKERLLHLEHLRKAGVPSG